MVNLAGTLSQISPKKILLAGDFFLDTYTIGKAVKISPEAPVAIVRAQEESHRPGGAGNVGLNLLSLGQEVRILGRVGDDPEGTLLQEMLTAEGVDPQGLFKEQRYFTPRKNRIIADNQQIVRVDHEEVRPLDPALEKKIIQQLPNLLSGIDVIALSDYGKGFLSNELLTCLIQWGREHNIPVIVDPKGLSFDKYRGATWLKPNLGEAYAAAMLPPEALLEEVAKELYSITRANVLMITRGSKGLTLFFDGKERRDFPVAVREVKDVTGAGDTVLAMVACCLANQVSFPETAVYCNLVGGLSVEHLGCARVTFADLAHALLKQDIHNKVFDEEHLFALQKAQEGRDWHLLSISAEQAFSRDVFQQIQRHKKEAKGDLAVAVSKEAPPDWVELLASLQEVDFVILHDKDPVEMERTLQPTTLAARSHI